MRSRKVETLLKLAKVLFHGKFTLFYVSPDTCLVEERSSHLAVPSIFEPSRLLYNTQFFQELSSRPFSAIGDRIHEEPTQKGTAYFNFSSCIDLYDVTNLNKCAHESFH